MRVESVALSLLACLFCLDSAVASLDEPKPTVTPLGEPAAALAPESNHDDADDFRYLIGAAIKYGPEYWGSKRYNGGLTPVWAMRWGKWRLSSSGGAALMGFGLQAIGPGAGANRELFKSDSLRVGLGLRLDGGRSASDDGVTAGLPEVERTLRGRIYAAYVLAPGWNLSGALSQDLAGKEGGLTVNLDLSRLLYKAADAELLAGLGLSGGNARYMRSYFGVSTDTANKPSSPWQGQAYEPGYGLREAYFNLAYTHAFSAHWVGFASAGMSRLLGPAAASPITQQLWGHSAGLSLAYRN